MRVLKLIGMVIISIPCSFAYAVMVASQMSAIFLDRLATKCMLIGMKLQTKLTDKWLGGL